MRHGNTKVTSGNGSEKGRKRENAVREEKKIDRRVRKTPTPLRLIRLATRNETEAIYGVCRRYHRRQLTTSSYRQLTTSTTKFCQRFCTTTAVLHLPLLFLPTFGLCECACSGMCSFEPKTITR